MRVSNVGLSQTLCIVVCMSGAALTTSLPSCAFGAERTPLWDPEQKPLERIAVGTVFGEQPPAGWTNTILFVEGKLASGDVSAASTTAHYYAELFNLVFLANVVRDATGRYELDRVAVGFSMKINEKNTIVTSDSQKKLGANLSFIGRSVLEGNEAALADIRQVARCATSMVFDAPTVMLHNGDHRQMIVRYFVWVSPTTGQVGTAVWLLDDQPGQRDYRVVGEHFQYLPPNMREKRIMNVKKDRFMFGIPAADAFALVSLPQGRPYGLTERMQQTAGIRSFTLDTYHELLAAISEAITSRTADR